MSIADAGTIERLRQAALQQPGARQRTGGDVKFQCAGCDEEGHDAHQDNARFFQRDGSWGCAVASGDPVRGRAHWNAIGRQLGAFDRRNGQPSAITEPSTDIGTRSDGLGLVTVGELLGEPDSAPAWVVERRLPAGGIGGNFGKPKSGKSTLMRALALKVARGEPWLGFATRQGPVIYLGLEEKRQEVRGHFRDLGTTGADEIHVLCATAPPDALERLRREAERRRPVLIIVDPLFRLVRVPAKGGDDYATMTAALEPLLVLARETGAHVLFVHHLGKGDRQEAGDAILGSTAIFGTVDTALILKRSERYRTLSSLQRYGDDLEEITLTLDPVTRDVTAGPPRVEAEIAEAMAVILTYLRSVPHPVTQVELEASVECRTTIKRRALKALLASGQVVRTGRGGKGDPFLYACSLIYPGTTEQETTVPSLTPGQLSR